MVDVSATKNRTDKREISDADLLIVEATQRDGVKHGMCI
jgi:hypothetical protein